jgi:signal transduction histidine kinase/ActR/RegA family two-component response regulator
LPFLLKTVLGVAAIEAALLLLLVIGSNSALADSLDSELDKRANTTLALLVAAARDAILSSDLATLESLADDTVKIPDVAYLKIISEEGLVLAQAYDKDFRQDQVEQVATDLSTSGTVRPSSRVLRIGGHAHATIEMGLSTANAVRAIDSLRNQNFIIAMSEMLLVALFSFLLARYLTSQLKKLDAATAAIAAGDLGLQIPVSGKDELAGTLRSFNKMSLELLASQKEQIVSEARLEALLSGMTNGVALLSHDLSIRYTNPRGQALLEHLCPDWKQTGQLRQLGTLKLQGALSNDILDETLEIAIRGVARFFSIHLVRVRGATGIESDWILTLCDVTSNRSREEHNRRRERLAVVGRLAAGIAHDFNNILGVIMGLTELNMSREDGIDGELRIDLETILAQAQRGSVLVRQILDFSRSDESIVPAIDIQEALASTVSMLCRTISSSITLSFEPNNEMQLLAMFEKSKLEQVTANLVINAVDAMPHGGSITVTATVKQGVMVRPGAPDGVSERWICIEVADTGEGIPRKNLVDVFEPFFTTKARGMGTGLGLAQVYGIVQQQGGDIAVQSEVGAGTTFTLFLRPAPAQQLEITRTPRQSTHTAAGDSKSDMILVVEDESALRRTTRAMLEGLGYRVITARDGNEGLDAYLRHKSDTSLVLTDAVMPNMDGIELVKALRADDCGIPIILMSGYFKHEGVDLRELGGKLDGFIEKPVSMNTLKEILSRTLAARHSRKEE